MDYRSTPPAAELATRLPRTLTEIDRTTTAGLQLGGQLYVSRGLEPIADLAFGEARPGESLDPGHLMLWLSATKPVAAIAIARLWENGLLDLDDRVAHHIPEFAAGGKEKVTIRHLLTHTGGLRMLNVGWPQEPTEAIVAKICARKLEPRWVPGEKAGYHLTSSWFILAELVRRLDGRAFQSYVRDEIFEPLGMVDSWIGMPRERFEAYGQRIAPTFNTEVDEPSSQGWESELRVTRPSPGGNGRGPMSELGRLYEALLNRGELDGFRLLSPQSVEALTTRQRVGLYDHTFKHMMDWGLGLIVNSLHYGVDTVPYGYGPHASRRTFGHSGYRSTVAFADPEHSLVVALAVNGTPTDAAHAARTGSLLGAIYEDLALAPTPVASAASG